MNTKSSIVLLVISVLITGILVYSCTLWGLFSAGGNLYEELQSGDPPHEQGTATSSPGPGQTSDPTSTPGMTTAPGSTGDPEMDVHINHETVLSLRTGDIRDDYVITINNRGEGILNYTIETKNTWITFEHHDDSYTRFIEEDVLPGGFAVGDPAEGNEGIQMTISAEGLTTGIYNDGIIEIRSNDPEKELDGFVIILTVTPF
ncbi:MAG: hypothetical protein JXB88_12750 [Spirochaetales bacterium]|nr:hypothetical protein [Spirochaetales bacterium]